MDELKKVRIQAIDPLNSDNVENVDVKTSDEVVYLQDGSTLRNWLSNFESTTANIQTLLAQKLASSKTFSVFVDTSDKSTWTTEKNGFSKTIPVEGITSKDNPIVGLKLVSTTKNGIELEKYAYSCIDSVVTLDGSIAIYCFEEMPNNDVILLLTCV